MHWLSYVIDQLLRAESLQSAKAIVMTSLVFQSHIEEAGLVCTMLLDSDLLEKKTE